VGASGAIFGLFGFSLVYQIAESKRANRSITPIIINFIFFIAINLYFSKSFNVDNASHFGGLAGGLMLGVAAAISSSYRVIKVEYFFLVLCLLAFMALPRFQVTYFQFFQKVLQLEDDSAALLDKKITDEEFLKEFKTSLQKWDTAHQMLRAHHYLPKPLHSDTFKLGSYIELRKTEVSYRISMIEKETFRYLDSLEIVQNKMRNLMQLDYPLTMLRPIVEEKQDSLPPSSLVRFQTWYDEDWVELSQPPGEYYRIGQRDSVGRWQGRVVDFYNDGTIQMKGFYHDDLRHGVFLYYSDYNTYTSVGRYQDGVAVGKWEYFHDNGKLKSEEYYRGGSFVKNWWDEQGNQLTENGEGRWIEYHDNGVIEESGSITGGKRNGRWFGLHEDATMYFEEYYDNGRLISGRSRAKDGQAFIYDASSEFPMPKGGNSVLLDYLRKNVKNLNHNEHGIVHLTFRVTAKQVLSDFVVDKKLNPFLDSMAIEIVKSGPTWLPARIHGDRPVSGWAKVTVQF